MRERQLPSQRGYGGWNKVCVSCALLFLRGRGITDFEVLEIREEPDEVQDLPARTSRTPESKESKCRRELSEALLNVWHETGYLEIVYPKLLEVRECRKATQRASVKAFGSKLGGRVRAQADTESLDEWKQTKFVRFLEWYGPHAPLVPWENHPVVCRERVVKMGDGCDVPRVTGHGARKEGRGVVNEAGDDHLHELLWEPGNWGQLCGRRVRGASTE